MITAIDTNILLDILIPDSQYCETSKSILEKYYHSGTMIICEAVYAELSSVFGSEQQLSTFMLETNIHLKNSNEKILYHSGLQFKKYAGKKSKKNQCTQCGINLMVSCPKCGKAYEPKQHILADFLIGAHAIEFADLLLSRDRGFYKKYFPELKVINTTA